MEDSIKKEEQNQVSLSPIINKKAIGISLALAIGSILIYFFLLHRISGALGGFIFFFFGWIFPAIFTICVSFLGAGLIVNKFRLSKVTFYIIIVGTILLLPVIPSFVDKNIYRLHTWGADEGCGCIYFYYGRENGGKQYPVSNIDNGRFILYATESFFKDFEPII